MSNLVEIPSQTPKRVRNALHALEGRADVDPRALRSVLNLCNPFPDGDLVGMGWPDSRSVPSLAMVDTQEFAITQPPGLPAGQTWDCHACILPFAADGLTGIAATASMDRFGVLTGAVATTVNGPYVVVTAPTGTNLNPIGPSVGATIAAAGNYYGLAAGSVFRVVAQGMEVVNTSASLYRGGMAYGYRIGGDNSQYSMQRIPAPATNSYTSARSMPRVPFTPSNVVNYKNTYEGMAEDGLYVVNTPVDDKPLESYACGQNLMIFNNPGSIPSSVTTIEGVGPLTGWNVAGGFLTGLAQGSSLVVRFRTYLEIFPNYNEGNGFIRLANRTVPYSPIIDEVLTRILAEMPAGGAYTDNPLGEWFEKVLESIAEYAPQVGDALGTIFPAAKLIGGGLGLVARGVGGTIASSRNKSNQKLAQASSSSSVSASQRVLSDLNDAKRTIRERIAPVPSAAARLRLARKRLMQNRK